jgi:acetyl esterase/lipase
MKISLVAAIAAASFALAAQAAPVKPAVAEKVVSTDQFPALHATWPGGVTGRPDLVYATINGFRPLTLDLYTPPKGKAPRPLVIYIHGGGWMNGTARNAAAYANFPAVLADLASRGYVVASLNYRLGSEAKFPAATQDVDAAIRWLKAHAADYGIDKTRVAIWGGSAGGQLAALAATDCSPAAAPSRATACRPRPSGTASSTSPRSAAGFRTTSGPTAPRRARSASLMRRTRRSS